MSMTAPPRDNPFQQFSARLMALQAIALLLGLTLPAAILNRWLGAEAIGSHLSFAARDLLFYVLWGSLLVYQLDVRGINLPRLVGSPASLRYWRALILLVGLLLLFSWGTFLLWLVGIQWLSPGLGQSLLPDLVAVPPSVQLWVVRGLDFVTLVVVAPIVEELAFRGILLHRWTLRFGIHPALVVSAVVFGLCHANPVGLSMFGLVMGVLYLRTRTLLVPIFCHSLNNLVATIPKLLHTPMMAPQAVSVPAFGWESGWWQAGLMLLVSAPTLILFIQRNWPRPAAVAPYFQNQAPLMLPIKRSPVRSTPL